MSQITPTCFRCLLLFLTILCAIVISSAGCRDASGRLNPAPTPEEQAKARAALANFKEADLAKDFAGGVMVEGRVIERLPNDPSGQAVWLVRPERFLLGKEQVAGDTIILTSMATRDGGVQLDVGEKYRIFTFEVDGHFMIWHLSVIEFNAIAKQS